MDHAMRSPKFDWIRRDTPYFNAGIRAVLSLLSDVGITWVWAGHWSWSAGAAITINLPAIESIAVFFYHWFGQFAMQHFGERVLDIGRTWKLDPQVLGQLAQVVADKMKEIPPPTPPVAVEK
jgi:hypothetical protein